MICLLAALAAFTVAWFHFLFSPRDLLGDWVYFNSLSLVIRSNVLVYGVFPLHDPWVGGGMDLLANPQSRIFSPFSLLDYVLVPKFANLLSMTIYAALGIWGGFRLLRKLRLSPTTAMTGAFAFISCSWYGLHYAEGHTPYGCMQLLPWVLYLTLTMHRPRSFFALVSLQALFLVDGGIYACIFSVFVMGSCMLTGISRPWRGLRRGWRPSPRQLGWLGAVLLAAGLIMSAKAIPVLALFVKRRPLLDFTAVPFTWMLRFLFQPTQAPVMTTMHPVYRFHEFGAYVSSVGLVVMVTALRARGFARRFRGFLLLAVFWLWVGSGWGGTLNPWHLFQRLPILNNAHLQSRVLILMVLFLMVPVAAAIDRLRARRRLHLALCAFFIVEGLYVHNVPFERMYRAWTTNPLPANVIRSTTISRTLKDGQKPFHYFTGQGSVGTYEPFAPPTRVIPVGDSRYAGEAYRLIGEGTVQLAAYTPGDITVVYDAKTPMLFGLNTNWLAGWAVTDGQGAARASLEGRIEVEVPPGRGWVQLRYRPRYFTSIVVAYLAGLALWVALARRLWHPRREMTKADGKFDYDGIPLGYYDDVIRDGKPIQRSWHLLKFERILDLLPQDRGLSLLDIGCFSGTFLGMVPERSFTRQLGVDILPAQVAYAQAKYGTAFRSFAVIDPDQGLDSVAGDFDCVTLIEVIEHLTPEQIRKLLAGIASKLKPGGTLVFSTPNYASAWPLVEILVNWLSDLSYEEQHITKFTYFNIADKLRRIAPTFDRKFSIELKTTSHFIAPFIAPLTGVERARAISRRVPHKTWKFPFGNLVILSLKRRPTSVG